MPICSCAVRAEAMRAGEMLRDSYGRWKWPLNFVTEAFHGPRPRYSWRFCPFCGDDLPFTDAPPPTPPYEASPDATGGDDGA